MCSIVLFLFFTWFQFKLDVGLAARVECLQIKASSFAWSASFVALPPGPGFLGVRKRNVATLPSCSQIRVGSWGQAYCFDGW